MSVFPIIKRFEDIKKTSNSVILTEELVIYEKCFRIGTVFQVLGWREISGKPYLVINKGSWESLVDYEEIKTKIESIEMH